MLSKVNISKIVIDHIKTMHKYKNPDLDLWDVFFFFAIPMIISIILVFLLRIYVSVNAINILVTSVSIFAALLFNLLLLVYDLVNKKENNTSSDSVKKNRIMLLRETFSNISFCIFISLIEILLLVLLIPGDEKNLITILFENHNMSYGLIITSLNILSFYFLIMFFLTLLMILKRVHIVLSKEIVSDF